LLYVTARLDSRKEAALPFHCRFSELEGFAKLQPS
jgi:hypothetical protein